MVAVVSNCGIPMMPTTEFRARRLLKKGRAVIFQYRPFTIKILDREAGETQPVEYKCDTGYQYIGISICSEKREFVNEQRDMLPDEVERHTKCRKYRRDRRNRKRYRKARFSNRRGKYARMGLHHLSETAGIYIFNCSGCIRKCCQSRLQCLRWDSLIHRC